MEFRNVIRVRSEVLTDFKCILYWSIFLGSLLLYIILVSYMASNMVGIKSVTVDNCYSGSMCLELEDGNAIWRARLNKVDLENQVIKLVMIPQSPKRSTFRFDLSLSVVGVDSETATEGHQILTSTKNYKVISGNRGLDVIFCLSILEYSSYIIELTFLSPIPEEITSIEFELSFVNRDFTLYQIAFKYSLFFLSVVSLIVYLSSLCTVPFRDWPQESKFWLVLSVSLVLLNEPLFVLNIYEPSEATFFFSCFCFSQFESIAWSWVFFRPSDYRSKHDPKNVLYVLSGIFMAANFVVAMVVYTEKDLNSRYGFNTGCLFDIFIFSVLAFLGLFVFEAIIFRFYAGLLPYIKNDVKDLLIFEFFTIMMKPVFFLYEIILFSGISMFWILFINFILYTFAFIEAPVQATVVKFQDFSKLGQEIVDYPEEEELLDITLMKEKIE